MRIPVPPRTPVPPQIPPTLPIGSVLYVDIAPADGGFNVYVARVGSNRRPEIELVVHFFERDDALRFARMYYATEKRHA